MDLDEYSNMICAVAGMTADANILINYARQAAQNYLLTYNEDISCEQLVRRLYDLKQGYTQHAGKSVPTNKNNTLDFHQYNWLIYPSTLMLARSLTFTQNPGFQL